MSSLQIPPVTIDDLQAFHAKHFPWVQSSPAPAHANDDKEVEEYADEEDDLGFYPDGNRRTLTDEQIKIFRHSEVHALLREKQLREEALAEKAKETADDNAMQSQQEEKSPNVTEDHKEKSNDNKTQHSGASDPVAKTSSYATLDYGEGAAQSAQRPQVQNMAQFTGRKIISYDD